MSDHPNVPGVTEADAVRADIEATRQELADTVNALTEKVNVKARAGDKAAELRQKLTEAAGRARAAAPPPVQRALDATGQKAGPMASRISAQAAPYRGKIIAGSAVLVAALLVLRRRSGDGADR
jgi:ElaB/YqjD/DUF883 family membrane-anchored ribosome-binding protein